MKYTPKWNKDGAWGGYFCTSTELNHAKIPCHLCGAPSWLHLLVREYIPPTDQAADGYSDRVALCRACAEPYVCLGRLAEVVT